MKDSWYREPWAWFVFSLPVISMVVGTTYYNIANNNADSMVVGDYYKKGKYINFEVGKVKMAQKLGMRFALQLKDNELIIKPTGIEKIFPLLNLNFFHPTLEEQDFYLSMTPDGNGHFRHKFDKEVTGKWKVTLSSFENTWKIQDTVNLPQSDFIDLIPDPIKVQ
jgi:hypothetical protein